MTEAKLTIREKARNDVLRAIQSSTEGITFAQLRVACYPMPISDALESLDREGMIKFEKDSMKWFRTSKPEGTIPYKLAKVGTIVNATDGIEITVVDKVAGCEGCVYLSTNGKRCEYLQKDFPDAWKDIPGRAYECLVQDLKWVNSLKPPAHRKLACEPDPWTEEEKGEVDDNDI